MSCSGIAAGMQVAITVESGETFSGHAVKEGHDCLTLTHPSSGKKFVIVDLGNGSVVARDMHTSHAAIYPVRKLGKEEEEEDEDMSHANAAKEASGRKLRMASDARKELSEVYANIHKLNSSIDTALKFANVSLEAARDEAREDAHDWSLDADELEAFIYQRTESETSLVDTINSLRDRFSFSGTASNVCDVIDRRGVVVGYCKYSRDTTNIFFLDNAHVGIRADVWECIAICDAVDENFFIDAPRSVDVSEYHKEIRKAFLGSHTRGTWRVKLEAAWDDKETMGFVTDGEGMVEAVLPERWPFCLVGEDEVIMISGIPRNTLRKDTRIVGQQHKLFFVYVHGDPEVGAVATSAMPSRKVSSHSIRSIDGTVIHFAFIRASICGRFRVYGTFSGQQLFEVLDGTIKVVCEEDVHSPTLILVPDTQDDLPWQKNITLFARNLVRQFTDRKEAIVRALAKARTIEDFDENLTEDVHEVCDSLVTDSGDASMFVDLDHPTMALRTYFHNCRGVTVQYVPGTMMVITQSEIIEYLAVLEAEQADADI